jgi:hypothetical protein
VREARTEEEEEMALARKARPASKSFKDALAKAVRTPVEKAAPKKRLRAVRKFNATAVANRVVTLLVKSMTPENRRAFHEGLRVAHKAAVTDALRAAFEAGRNNPDCTFEV